MKIEKIIVGELKCNCYILNIDDDILIIDPGSDSEKIIKSIGNRNVRGIIVTHHHFDHDGAVSDLLDKYDTVMYDKNNLSEGMIQLGKFNFEVIYTPGHKEDLITIYFKREKVMFCGDFIFRNSIGRCDLAGGNVSDMIKSIEKIKKYEMDTIIYPGHGHSTTLRYEIINNPYFNDFL